MIELRALSLNDALVVLRWREGVPETLRTTKPLTEIEQEQWYRAQIARRDSSTRYFGLWDDGRYIGYGGVEHISWENGSAEISLLIAPEERGHGHGRAAVLAILDHAFGRLGLSYVRGRCYECSPAVGFWEKMCEEFGGRYTRPPIEADEVKLWNGRHFGVLAFGFRRSAWVNFDSPLSREEANYKSAVYG